MSAMQAEIEFSTTIEAPPKRVRQLRLTDQLKGIQPGQSVLLDLPTARCLIQFLRVKKFSYVQRSEGDGMRVWRTA